MSSLPRQTRPRSIGLRRMISGHLTGALVFSVFVNILFLASPLFMMQVYGRVLDSRSIETLVALSAILVLALLAMAAADAGRGRLLVRASARVERRLAAPLARATLRTGSGARAAMTDLENLRRVLAGSSATTLLDAPFTVLFLAVLYLLHPVLGLVATVGSAVILGAVALSRWLDGGRERDIALGRATVETMAAELDRSPDELRAIGTRSGLAGHLLGPLQATGGLRQTGGEATARLGAFTRFVRMVAHSGSLAAGAVLTLQGDLAPAAMLASAILAGRALGPMEHLLTAIRQAGEARAALGRIAQRLDQAETAPPTISGQGASIHLHRAMVMGKSDSRAALRSVSLEIAAGEVIAVAGKTGAGKSTLAQVLAGATSLRSGQIRVAGHDPRNLTGGETRQIGWMPQEITLFPGTVAQNIAGFAEADPESIRAAAEMAGATDAIDSLPQGLSTEVGLGGRELSPGIRQRVALARALFGKPQLVILDQPTSHMDAEGEVATLNAIRSLRAAGSTVIVISHKPVLAALADRILMLRDGAVELFEDRATVIDAMRKPALRPVPPQTAAPQTHAHQPHAPQPHAPARKEAAQ